MLVINTSNTGHFIVYL